MGHSIDEVIYMKESYWVKHAGQKETYPSISKEMDANIVIVGAGLTGLSTAYYLSKVTNDVFVLEADEVCYGASGRNTGKVTAQHGLLYKDIIEMYGRDFALQYYQANEEAIQSIASIIEEHHIACDFQRCSAALFTQDKTMIAQLQDEYQAYLDLRIPCTFIEHTPFPFAIEAGLQMHYQAKFNPYAYGQALAKMISEAGIHIYEHSPVETMVNDDDGTYTLLVNGKKIHANKVIFASQFPFIDHAHLYFTRMYCEQESIICAELKEDAPDTMMLNIEKPLHSYNGYGQRMFIGGKNYKSGQTCEVSEENFHAHALKTFHLDTIDDEWSSQDYITFDKLPFIGKLDKYNEKILFASGFNKWGNTTSNIAGKLLCAHVLDQPSQYRSLFSPQRFKNIFSAPFVKENLNVAYEFIKGKIKHGDHEYPYIQQGKAMQIDGHTYGVYRDEYEALFIVDITCPHLGCICNFNAVDKTWDCPCHGSRYSYTGEIVKGPTTQCLRPYGDGLNPIQPHIFKQNNSHNE